MVVLSWLPHLPLCIQSGTLICEMMPRAVVVGFPSAKPLQKYSHRHTPRYVPQLSLNLARLRQRFNHQEYLTEVLENAVSLTFLLL